MSSLGGNRNEKRIVLACVLLAAAITIYAQQNPTLQEGVATVLNKEFSAYLSEKPDFGAAIAVVDDTLLYLKSINSNIYSLSLLLDNLLSQR